ncbi:arylsulfatase B-like isoform X2 [Anneissia japonica]|uniref:arylsulfatase B-like isoform X2 n=1 Tax=Anneissia japonica TaxID=1529436 RepID=UPI00142577EF|nr:arylsulfatase B-like isoform X2 [Anneissia japonica]
MESRKVFVLFIIIFSLHLTNANGKFKKYNKMFKKFEAKSAKSSQPNILFILSDDHGYRDVGYHGSLFDTPVLDEMAAKGVKLENYYVQPICSPTRSQLLTGRYQIHTGLQHAVLQPTAPACLPTDEITLAQKMKEAGYATHMIGKWHMGFYEEACLPNNRGFDTYLGLLLGGGYHFTHSFPTPQYYDFHKDCSAAKEYNGTYSTYAMTDRAIDIINNQDGDKPFFMYLAYQAPHAPLEVPEQYKDPYRSTFKDDDNRLTYAGMVSCLDEGVGNVTAALKAKGLYDNTVIIFSSDNGGSIQDGGNNWPLRGCKLSMFEGGMRAIGFVHSPLLSDNVKGTVSNELYHVSDWFPTFVEGIAGWNTDGTKPLDGFNQWESIRDGTPSSRIELLHNIDPLWVVPGGRDCVRELSPFNISINAALRHGDWKIVTGDNGKTGWYAPPDTGICTISGPTTDQITWLFNIKEDPLEKNDLSDERPDILFFLLEKLQKYYLDSVPVFYPDTQVAQADPCTNGNDCVWGPWTPI